MKSSKVNINDEDNSVLAEDVLQGITGFRGVTERGPFDDPSRILTTEADYRKYFGNESSTNPFPEQVIRHLQKGGKARVSRVGHYTDVTDKSTITATFATGLTLSSSGSVELFKLKPKYRGANYGKIMVVNSAPTNGKAGYFNLSIFITLNGGTTKEAVENYENLKIQNTTIATQNWGNAINRDSNLVILEYVDLSSAAANLVPSTGGPAKLFTGGTDGDPAVPADYIGSAVSGIGFHSFNPYDDMFQICTPAVHNEDIHNGGALYVDARKDLFYFIHLDPNVQDEDDLISQRNLITVDTKYIGIFSGGILVTDLLANQASSVTRGISEVGDVCLIATRNDETNYPWISFANYVRGYVSDAKGVIKNFGSPGEVGKLDKLANAQINMMVQRNGITYLSGNFTGQYSVESKASYLHVVRLLIYLRKILRPILERYLEDPTDVETFRRIWHDVKPELDFIKNNRGLYDYVWDGDQNISHISQVTINNLTDLDAGKYKVKLRLEPINGLGEITVDISLNRAGSLSIELEEETL